MLSVCLTGPQIKQTFGPRMVVLVGKDEVKLRCNVKYAQNYDWYKDGVWISPTFSDRYNVKVNRFLEIISVEKADGGLFYCVTSSNRKQFANCSIELIVAGMGSLVDSTGIPSFVEISNVSTLSF